MSSLGERFRIAREARGLTLSEVAEHIRIRSVYLGAIEDENWDVIGAPVYARGFVRTYARFLGIDGEEAIASSILAQSIPSSTPPQEEPVISPSGRRSSTRWVLWVAGFVAAALVGLIVYNLFALPPGPPAAPVAVVGATPTALPSASPTVGPSGSPLPSESPSPGAASPSPGAASPSPGASATPPPGSGSLGVTIRATSWVRVIVDGKIMLEGTFPAGTTRVLYGKKAVVRIGNAGGVELDVNGTSLGSLGKDGVVVDRTISL